MLIEQCDLQHRRARNRSSRWCQHAGNDIHQGGLAGAIPSDNSPMIAFADCETDIFDDRNAGEINTNAIHCNLTHLLRFNLYSTRLLPSFTAETQRRRDSTEIYRARL